MEQGLSQSQVITMDKSGNVILDVESLAQSLDMNSGSPKMTRVLSRKGSYRLERRCCPDEDEIDEASRKLLLKMNSHLEPLITTKTLSTVAPAINGPALVEAVDGRCKRFNRFMSLNPRKILLLFATMSSMGTMILIYFTLAINRKTLSVEGR
ncbi:hypothetical protein Scep_016025 [Stephania cephalantha]|uniref:Uncharacterized protein n=1 Tax=Stephania cephalantha TaxID=152367 RepID=A0AAP0INR8_9MAGN